MHDSERSTGYPNLALMKLSAWHKLQGDTVEWFNPLFQGYDIVYSSKVFTWTQTNPYLPSDTIKGGTGYGSYKVLPDEIEHIMPDYSLYNCKHSYGFLTRGCPNKCSWCFVPDKEGSIRANADIEEFLQHKTAVIMDHNVLASDHGIKQIEKIIQLKIKVDFNQGLDARLIDEPMAKLLAKVKWLHPLRMACDSASQMKHIERATRLLRYHNCKPQKYFCYVLVKDIADALERVKFLKGLYIDPFAQAYRNKAGDEPTEEQKAFCRWVDMKSTFMSTTWEDYSW